LHRQAGFTLIEAALTTIIVGTGVLAIVAAQQAYHQKNEWSMRANTGMLLANEIRELTISLPLHDPIGGNSNIGPEENEGDVAAYDDVDDFGGPLNSDGFGQGTTIEPPIDALRQRKETMERWSQHVEVQRLSPEEIDASEPLAWEEDSTVDVEVARVTVTVRYQGPNMNQSRGVTELTWVVTEKL
jgi:type II secretory pathway pseudopilin PulG